MPTKCSARGLKTILCVDDNHAGLKTRKMLLEAAGYRVLTADHPRMALEILNQSAVGPRDTRLPNARDGRLSAGE